MQPPIIFDGRILINATVEKPKNYTDRAGNQIKIVKITSETGFEFYKVDHLGIYADTPEGCIQLKLLFEELPQRGDFGKLIYRDTKNLMKSNKFALFGTATSMLSEIPASAGIFISKKFTYFGIPADSGMVVALKRHPIEIKLFTYHEFSHFFFGDHNVFSSLPPKLTKNLNKVWESEKLRLSKNPYPIGSAKWNVHNLMYRYIFEQPLLTEDPFVRYSEMVAYTMQFEATFGEEMLMNFSKPLRNASLDIAKYRSEHPTELNRTLSSGPSIYRSNPSKPNPFNNYLGDFDCPPSMILESYMSNELQYTSITHRKIPDGLDSAFVKRYDRLYYKSKEFIKILNEAKNSFTAELNAELDIFEQMCDEFGRRGEFRLSNERLTYYEKRLLNAENQFQRKSRGIPDKVWKEKPLEKRSSLRPSQKSSNAPSPYETMHKAISVDYAQSGLRGCAVFHGTMQDHVESVLQGPKNISGGVGGKGLYLALENDKKITADYAGKGNQKGVVLEGKMNPDKNFRIARIQMASRNSAGDINKGIFPWNWSKNEELQRFMLEKFDIIEVCGAADAGYAIDSNRYLVVTERAGSDAIQWKDKDKLIYERAQRAERQLRGSALPEKPNPANRNTGVPIDHEARMENLQRLLNKYSTSNLTFTSPNIPTSAHNSPFNTLINNIGRAIGKTFQRTAHMGMRGLQIASHPAVIGPVSIICAYKREEEHALCKGLINGTVPLTFTFAGWNTLSLLIGGVPTIVVGIGVIGSELLPDLHELERQLPSKEEIESLRHWEPELATLMEGESVQQLRDFLIVGGMAQKGLQKIGRFIPELYEKHIRPQVNQEIDEFFAKRDYEKLEALIEEDPSLSPNPLAPYEKILEMGFDEYLENYPYTDEELQQRDPRQVENRPFKPNLETLEVLTRPSNSDYVDTRILDDCDLTWVVTPKELQTMVEISPDEVEAIQNSTSIEEEEVIRQRPGHVLLTPLHQEREEKPQFVELAKIVAVKFETVFLGQQLRPGLVFTLKSGAKFSLSTTGTDFITNISAPLTKGFFKTVGTGVIYQIPVAAALLAIHHFTSNAEKKIEKQLKQDAKNASKEMDKVGKSLQQFEAFAEQFNNGQIKTEEFLQKANEESEKLQKSADRMKKKSDYADKHAEGNNPYLFERTKLQQIDLDLKKLVRQNITFNEVQKDYVPQIQQLPLPELVSKLKNFSDKRVLSMTENFQQQALHKEIQLRSNSEGLNSLDTLKPLAECPMAISIDAPAIAKPSNISRKHYGSVKHDGDYVQRQYDRVKSWAKKVDSLYSQFQTACTNGNAGEIVRLGGLLKDQIDRVENKKNHDKVNLDKYEISGVHKTPKEYYQNAFEYYKEYIDKIKDSYDTGLARVKAAQSGTISETNQAYFTNEEIQAWKSQIATQCVNKALAKFVSDHPTPEEKNSAFASLYEASKAKKTLGDDVTSLKEVFEIGDNFESYSAYEQEQNRLENVQKGLQNLQQLTKQMNNPNIDSKEISRLFKLAYEQANELKFTNEDIEKIIQNTSDEELNVNEEDCATTSEEPKVNEEEDPKNSQKATPAEIVAWVDSIKKEYPEFVRREGLLKQVSDYLKTQKLLGDSENKRDKVLQLQKEANDQAEKLLKEGLSLEDLQKSLEPKQAEEIWQSIKSNAKHYQDFLSIDRYTTQMLPLVSAPLSKFAITVLRDSYRYERPLWNFGVKSLVTAHSFAPEVLPEIINFQIARNLPVNIARSFQANTEVINALGNRIQSAAKNNNVLVSFLRETEEDFELKSFSKKTKTVKATNMALQLFASIVPSETLQRMAYLSSHISGMMDYTNSIQKTIKYYTGGSFFDKLHKIDNGLLSTAMAPFDICEFLATDPSEFGFAKNFIGILQSHLPTFHGNLPESPAYYAGKDATYMAGRTMLALKGNYRLIGEAGLQAATMLWKTYQGSYTNAALAAIMTNLRWFQKQNKTPETINSMTASYHNLNNLLGDLTILPSDYEFNQLKLKAKAVAFEGWVDKWKREKDWDKIITETEISQDGHTFKQIGLNLYEGAFIPLKRYKAILKKMNDSKFIKEHFISSLEELEKVIAYFKTYSNRDRFKNTIQNLECIREDFLTNFFIFYITDKIEIDPKYVLSRFDAVPAKSRQVIHWYALGHLVGMLVLDRPLMQLNALRLFSFEKILNLLHEKKSKEESLSEFEESMEESCRRMLDALTNTVSGPCRFDADTQKFAPIIEEILSE